MSLSREFDWSHRFLALQLLLIDSSLTLLRQNKKDKEFRECVEQTHGEKPKIDALKAAVQAHAEAELDKQVKEKDLDEAKKKLEETLSSLPRQDWCTVSIFSRQVIAHGSTGFLNIESTLFIIAITEYYVT
jgi:hypothetical protein